jgi:hypothetical protein
MQYGNSNKEWKQRQNVIELVRLTLIGLGTWSARTAAKKGAKLAASQLRRSALIGAAAGVGFTYTAEWHPDTLHHTNANHPRYGVL